MIIMRKSPVNHYRRPHTRKGKQVSGGYVGNGSAVNPTFKYPKDEDKKKKKKKNKGFFGFTLDPNPYPSTINANDILYFESLKKTKKK